MSVPADAPAPAAPAIRDTRAAGLRAGAGLFAGFVLLALVDAAAIALRVPRPYGGVGLRVAHHVFDAAETLGVGAVLAAIVGGFSARVRLPPWGAAIVYTAVTAPLVQLGFADQLYREACVALDGRFTMPIFLVAAFFTSFVVTAAHFLGAYLSAYPRLRWVAFGASLAGMIVDHLHLWDDYFSIHCAGAWIAATCAGASIAPLAERALYALWSRPRGRMALAAIGLFAAFGLVVPPSNAVRVELFRQPVTIGPWVLSSLVWRSPHPRAPTPPTASRWIQDRSAAPPVPPSPRTGVSNPVVVLITIDATRADAVNDPDHDVLFPTFAQMKQRGVWFTRASSPGSQTAVSLTALFSGRYFSELRWAMHGNGASRFLYAADDPAPRFPELLAKAGVATADYCSINFLAGDFGVARGFREEKMVAEGRRHAYARQMIDPLLDRLKNAGNEPLFLYTHLMEPHAPYDRGRKDGTEWERYLSEIAVADAQVGRVWRLLEQRFPTRGVLIVSADHGEAFGEHQTKEHTKTIYEELLRVPLLVRGAGIAHMKVDDRVGLVDLGPTILDLFALPTPATYNGQSLAPFLWGKRTTLDRPLLAEGRLRRALYTADGLKVITDERRKLVEVFDLEKDPGELHNLWDDDPARSDRALGALEAFYAAHARGTPPYKP